MSETKPLLINTVKKRGRGRPRIHSVRVKGPRGRPRKYHTDEERKEAKRKQTLKSDIKRGHTKFKEGMIFE